MKGDLAHHVVALAQHGAVIPDEIVIFIADVISIVRIKIASFVWGFLHQQSTHVGFKTVQVEK